ncbi:MAG: ATP-binding domain-containing protein, partial [Treponema sp.]|nr:ATP-binding domain-containing protein [Treponema sp.]
MMNDNYRSSPQIVGAANSLISKNTVRMKKELRSLLPDGQSVRYHHAKTAREEAQWIADYIRTLVQNENAQLKDISILYRAHYISRIVEETLTAEKLPFVLYSGVQFFEREEIKDALSYLRMIAYRDDLSFRRIVNKPRRNIGKSRMETLERFATEQNTTLYAALVHAVDAADFSPTGAQNFIALIERFAEQAQGMQVSELLGTILDASGYESMLRTEGNQTRLDNLAELKQSIYAFENSCGEECTLEYYLAHASQMTSLDVGTKQNVVKLMTVHAAKGLEFPHLIVAGLNEGMFPGKKVRDRAAMEEERRLAFVAVTRAQKTLALTEAAGSALDGSVRYPSRFIFDIGHEWLTCTTELDETFMHHARAYIARDERILDAEDRAHLFADGARVRHAILGVGTIVRMDYNKHAYVIQFDRLPTERLISFHVRLEPER